MIFNKFFNPRSIALIGATDRPGSVGSGICRNLLEGRGKRKIFFINPFRNKVSGKKSYPSIDSIKESIDVAVIAVPAKIVLKVVRESIQKKVGGLVIISAGFAETGKEGRILEEKISKMALDANIPLLGPNCLGVIRPSRCLNATFAPSIPPVGNIALVSQSGALIDSIIDESLLKKYGFSTIISYGNEAGLDVSDFLLWLGQDKETKVIALYIEGLKQGRKFIEVAKDVARIKPIVAIRAGRTEKGRKAILSHTASLASSSEVYSAVFRQTGIWEVGTLQELLDVAKALAWQPRCKNGIGIITNGGGCGVLATDYCEEAGINLPCLSPKTIQNLEKSGVMHSAFSRKNPLDIVGDALSNRYEVAIDTLLNQKNIYGLLIIQTLQIMTETEKNAKMIIRARKKWPNKPIISCFMGGKFTKPGIDLLEKNKIPNYLDPYRAVLAIKALIK